MTKEKEKVMVKCPNCEGSGKESFYIGIRIGGTGKYPAYDTRSCSMCEGEGKVAAEVAE